MKIIFLSFSSKTNNYGAVSIVFGKALSKTEIDNGASLIIRAYLADSTNNYVIYSYASPLDTLTADFVDGGAIAGTIYNNARNGFTNLVISNDLVKALATSDGSLSGFIFYPNGHSTYADFTIYIDEVSYLTGAQTSAINAVIKDSYADILKAQNTFAKALNKWLDKEVSIELELIERGEFVKALRESEQDITPANLDILSVLFKGEKKAEIKVDEAEIDSLLED